MVTEQLFLLYIFTYDLVMKSHLGFLGALLADDELFELGDLDLLLETLLLELTGTNDG